MYKLFLEGTLEHWDFVTPSLAFQLNIFDSIVVGKCVSLFFPYFSFPFFYLLLAPRLGQQFGGIKTANE